MKMITHFYDEYMNSEIVYSQRKITHIQDRLNRIEKFIWRSIDPNNVNAVKDLIQQVSANGVHSNINAINNSSLTALLLNTDVNGVTVNNINRLNNIGSLTDNIPLVNNLNNLNQQPINIYNENNLNNMNNMNNSLVNNVNRTGSVNTALNNPSKWYSSINVNHNVNGTHAVNATVHMQ